MVIFYIFTFDFSFLTTCGNTILEIQLHEGYEVKR